MGALGRWWALALALGIAACGGRQSVLALEGVPQEKLGDATALVEQGDALFAEREDRAKLEEALATWEEAAKLDPTRADIQLKLAYGYHFLAEAHLAWADEEADHYKADLMAAYDKGAIAGERAIGLSSPAFAEKIRSGGKWEDAIPLADQAAVPALYWYATNMGKWARLDGITTILSLKDRAYAIIDHCRQLDPSFWYGAPDRYFGVYYVSLPVGSDPGRSREHFTKSEGYGRADDGRVRYLETLVLFASSYATKAGDRALFVEKLQQVVDAPDDIAPEIVPENRNAKRRAQRLLAQVDDLF